MMSWLVRVALAVAVFSPMAAQADDGALFIDGTWIGKGVFQIGQDISACSEVTMKFGGSKTAYEVREASMFCGSGPKQDFTEIDLFRVEDDGEIVFEKGTATTLAKGTKVGVVKDGKLRTLNPIDGGGVDDISIAKAGDFLLYSQSAGAPGETPAYSLVAILKKAPPVTAKP